MTTVRKMVERPTDSAGQLVITDAAAGKMDTYVSSASSTVAGKIQLAGSLAGTSTVPIVVHGDPWEYPTGGADEVFSDEFTAFSGWSVCAAGNTGVPLVPTSPCSLFRSLAAGPGIDVATRLSTMLVQPTCTGTSQTSIYQDIHSVLDFSGNWTIVAKISIPLHYHYQGSDCAMLAVSKPSGANLVYDAVSVWPVAGSGLNQALRYINSGGSWTSADWYSATEYMLKPQSYWCMLSHASASTYVYGFISYDGLTWYEMGGYNKTSGASPTTFTTVSLSFLFQKNASAYTYAMYAVDYVRAYNSLKLR